MKTYSIALIPGDGIGKNFADMLEHLGEGHAAAEVMSAIESVTARGLGTIAGKDRTETILQGVLAALS